MFIINSSYINNLLSKKLFFLSFLCFFVSKGLEAKQVLQVNDTSVYISNQFSELLVYCDTNQQITNPSQLKGKHFVNILGDLKISGSKYHYWYKVPVLIKSEKPIVLEVLDHYLPQVSAYASNYKLGIAGQGLPFNIRKNQYEVQNLVFDIPLNQYYNENNIYIHTLSNHPQYFTFKIHSAKSMTGYLTKEYWTLGIFYGILFTVLIYNLILFIASRESLYIYYIFYVTACMLITSSEDSMGFQFVWPDYPWINSYVNFHFAPGLFVLTLSLYAYHFLELKNKRIVATWILLGLFLQHIICSLLIFWGKDLGLYFYFSIIALSTYIWILAIWSYKRGYKSSRLFLVAYSFVEISLIINFLRYGGWIKANVFLVYALNYAIIFDAIVMTFAIGDKFRLLRREKEKLTAKVLDELRKNNQLSEQVNRELEEKVRSRTQELSQKTEELKSVSDELKRVNSLLDKENWNLNKQVKEQVKARAMSDFLSFEEFSEAFINENACFQLLNNLKWENGFKCKKCGYDKFQNLQKSMSRKCAKCNSIESSTANTLFHGVRFHLVKAFYITYTCVNNKDSFNIEELATKLDIAKNTVWKFKKKVEEKIAEIQSNSKTKKNNLHWEDIILD